MDAVGLAVGGTFAYLGSSYLQSSLLYLEGQQIWAEWTAWGLVALACWLRSRYLSRGSTQFSSDEEKITPSSPRWSKLRLFDNGSTLVAFLLVTAQYIATRASGEQLRWALPVVTLFTFLAVTFSRASPSRSSDVESDAPQTWQKIMPASLGRRCDYGATTALTAGTCVISAIALLPQDQVFDQNVFVFGIAYAALTGAAYFLLSGMSSEDSSNDLDGTFFSKLIAQVESISIRAFAICTLLLAITSTPIPKLRFLILVFAILRVAQLFAVLSLCTANFAVAATTMLTASASISGGIVTTAPFPGPVHVLVTLAALIQAYTSLPKNRSSRAWLFVILLVPMIRALFSPETIASPGTPASSITLDGPVGRVHPIQKLVKDNQELFDKKLATQSQTVEDAAREYTRRYGRLPPPGFDKWFEIAREKDFLFIDELDTVMESLEPFWGISPASLRARIKSVQKAEWISSVTVGYDEVVQSGDHYHVDYMKQWLNRTTWGDIIPEVNFVISTLDEPRVVAPDDTVDLAMRKIIQAKEDTKAQPWWATETPAGHKPKSKAKSDDVKWISVGKQDAWEAMVSSCHIDDPARSETTVSKVKPLFPFVKNVTANMDVCASSDLLHYHGFLASPDSLMVTHSLVPIFSQCKPSIFNDVLYPSPYYQMQITSGDYNETEDPAWDDKTDRMYWAGAGTGGYTTSQNWMKMHRQRLTMMTDFDNGRSVNLLERDVHGEWHPRMTTWSDISDMFYMRITGTCQCSEESCEAQKQRFDSPKEEKSAALSSKYMLDIDGNTFSGRFYRLLKSNGVVLKYTAFKEWHDSRLIPWVHYIPVSSGAEELGETMRFLLNEEEGKEIGKNIAEQSRDWTRKTLRVEDLEVVFVRVLMEYARIMNDDRDKMGFEVEKGR